MSLICPNCGAPLTERAWAGVTVDACLGCRGLWMDRGELDRLVAALQGRARRQARPPAEAQPPREEPAPPEPPRLRFPLFD